MNLRKAEKTAVALTWQLEAEEVALDSALGRVLAEEIVSERNIPGEYRSKWDGFALAASETEGAGPDSPVFFEIAPGFIAAGGGSGESASANSRCFRIMTGAALPGGTDAVIPQEDAPQAEGRLLVLKQSLKPGQGVILPGSDAGAGDIILERGEALTATRLALAAALGIARVKVHRRPRVAILATGDELREIGANHSGPVTFCNNLHLLHAMVGSGGGEPIRLGIAPDDPDVIFEKLERAAADLVVTTGGMGRGKKDFMLEVWKRFGVAVHFDFLNISPGRGSALGSAGKRLFLALPGNPWAAQVIFEEIGIPIMRRFQSMKIWGKRSMEAQITASLENRKDYYRVFNGTLSIVGHTAFFIPLGAHQRGPRLLQVRNCPAYTILCPRRGHVPEGEIVEVKIPDLPLSAWSALNP